jgi:hypothetical protein
VQSMTAQAANMLISCGPCSQPALQMLQMGNQSNSQADNNVLAAIQNVDMANAGATQAVTFVQSADASTAQAILFLANCSACPTDITGDGVTNVDDLLAVINGWGQSGPSDVNLDGTTNVDDLLEVINGWGQCA